MAELPPHRQRRGCIFYLLIASSVIFLMLLAGLLVGMRYAKKMVTDFTEDKPRVVPAATLPEGEFRELQGRIDAFRKAVRGGVAKEPLTLTAQEINALINQDEDFKALKGKVFVTMDGSQVKGQVSVPMDQINLPLFKGRYLNADAQFKISLNNGILRLVAQEVKVKGRPIPDIYMDTIRKQNLVRDLISEPRASAALDALDRVEIQDGKLVVYPKIVAQ